MVETRRLVGIGLGLGGELNLSVAEQTILAEEAAIFGYTSIWTNEGTAKKIAP